MRWRSTIPVLCVLLAGGLASAAEPDQLRAAAERLRRTAAELAERGLSEQAEQVERRVLALREEAERLERGESPDPGFHPPQRGGLQRELERLRDEERDLEREGGERRLDEVRHEIGLIERELPRAPRPPQHGRPGFGPPRFGGGPPHRGEPEARKRGPLGPHHAGPPRREPHHETPHHAERTEQLHHLRHAAELARLGGAPELAEQLDRRADEVERSLSVHQRPSPAIDEVLHQLEELRRAIEELREEVVQLREHRETRRPRQRPRGGIDRPGPQRRQRAADVL